MLQRNFIISWSRPLNSWPLRTVTSEHSNECDYILIISRKRVNNVYISDLIAKVTFSCLTSPHLCFASKPDLIFQLKLLATIPSMCVLLILAYELNAHPNQDKFDSPDIKLKVVLCQHLTRPLITQSIMF